MRDYLARDGEQGASVEPTSFDRSSLTSARRPINCPRADHDLPLNDFASATTCKRDLSTIARRTNHAHTAKIIDVNIRRRIHFALVDGAAVGETPATPGRAVWVKCLGGRRAVGAEDKNPKPSDNQSRRLILMWAAKVNDPCGYRGATVVRFVILEPTCQCQVVTSLVSAVGCEDRSRGWFALGVIAGSGTAGLTRTVSSGFATGLSK